MTEPGGLYDPALEDFLKGAGIPPAQAAAASRRPSPNGREPDPIPGGLPHPATGELVRDVTGEPIVTIGYGRGEDGAVIERQVPVSVAMALWTQAILTEVTHLRGLVSSALEELTRLNAAIGEVRDQFGKPLFGGRKRGIQGQGPTA